MHPAPFATAMLVIAALAGSAGAADRPMTGAEFDAYTRGKTLFYGINGFNYGVEEYSGDRRVRWSFLGDECVDGYWYESGTDICFRYEGRVENQCWQFFLGDDGLTARVSGADGSPTVYEVRQSPEPMQCFGPSTGA